MIDDLNMHAGLTSYSLLSVHFVDKQKVGGCGLNKGHIWPKGDFGSVC